MKTKKIILFFGVYIFMTAMAKGQDNIQLNCLQGLWQRLSLKERPNQESFEIYHGSDLISIFTYAYKGTIKLELHLSKNGYINDEGLDSVKIKDIKPSGKYYIHTEYPNKNNTKVKITVYENDSYHIDCDEESYEILGANIISYARRKYIPLRIWNLLKSYNIKNNVDYIQQFDLGKYNPNIHIVAGTILYKDEEEKTIHKRLDKEYNVQVIDQLWNMLKIKEKDFMGWIEIKNVKVVEKLF